jgi:hypothetical protein
MSDLIIGIDCGVNTGFAVWNTASMSFDRIETLPIHRAILSIIDYHQQGRLIGIIVEDARKRKLFKGLGNIDNRAQGAGYVKRDAVIYEQLCKDYSIAVVFKSPRNTKVNADYFKVLARWYDRTSSHARDAAMLVIGMTAKYFHALRKEE